MRTNLLAILKSRAKELKSQLVVVYYASKHPKVPALSKVLIGLAILYALSPIDLVPDFIPVLGYLDDLLLIPILMTLAIRMIPDQVLAECRERAQREPVRLAKNWTFGVLFIAIWLAVLAVIGNGVLASLRT